MEKKFKERVFNTRRTVDRRKFKDRRFFPRHEDLDHAPERRVNMFDRRILGDRRRLFPESMKTFREEVL